MPSPHFVPDTAALVQIERQVRTCHLIPSGILETAVPKAALLGQAATAFSPMPRVGWAGR